MGNAFANEGCKTVCCTFVYCKVGAQTLQIPTRLRVVVQLPLHLLLPRRRHEPLEHALSLLPRHRAREFGSEDVFRAALLHFIFAESAQRRDCIRVHIRYSGNPLDNY
eukprot:6201586-Pleurochrysis_carterae.AAC.4